MNETTSTKTPVHLWVVGVIALLWNAMGAYDYLMMQTENAGYLAQYTEPQLAYFRDFPVWATAVWAIAVWSGVLGSVLLLMRKKLAEPVFLVGLVAFVVSTIRTATSGGFDVMGGAGTGFSAVIFLVAVFLYFYSRAMRTRGVLK